MSTDERKHTRIKRMNDLSRSLNWPIISIMIVVVFMLIILLVAPSEAAMSWSDRYTSEYAGQYASHYAVGFVVGATTSYVLKKKFPDLNPWVAGLISVAVPLAIGAVVESFDDYPDYRDAMEYGFGGTLGVVVFRF